MEVIELLQRLLPPDRVKTKIIDLVSFASDAGFYSLRPKVVVLPKSEAEVIELFKISQETQTPMVFRTAGTSLSGQSITDGILVDLSQNWRNIQVQNEGQTVRVQPGITGAMVNAHLKKFGRKIGPDPASINAAMMGGILSNNASGMCCGVAQNSYHTLRHLTFILPDGQTFCTEKTDDYARFEVQPLAQKIVKIKNEILENTSLFEKIRHKYLTKTTIGYSLNAFVDFEHPLDIFAHLLIGAEGTLGFISEAVLNTVPDYKYKATAMMYFDTLSNACQTIVPLKDLGAMTVELMDGASLHAVKNEKAIEKNLTLQNCALLVEFQEESDELLQERIRVFEKQKGDFQTLKPVAFTTDPSLQAAFWKIRKGLFPSVGAVRKSGTTVVLEDVAFPVEKLADALADLQKLFDKYHYQNAIIFGHAKDGNIHFVVTQSFDTDYELNRYDAFMTDVVQVVVEKYNGTLKGEHGTGRNMAPFVATEWGAEAFQIMQQLKLAADPLGLLNPGVIINNDPKIHLKNLKKMPSVEAEVDKCTECGFCEPLCPSRDLTTSPRRRIVARRALKSLENGSEYQELLSQYQFYGSETCAVDGLCATACPVEINTGDLTKRLRRENHNWLSNRIALFVSKNFGLTIQTLRFSLKTGEKINRYLGENTMLKLTKFFKKVAPSLPNWPSGIQVPELWMVKPETSLQKPDLIYFPSCISRLMGAYEGQSKNLMETFLSVADKSGQNVKIITDYQSSCCSQIFGSKGYQAAQVFQANQIIDRLWFDSHQGETPIVVDVSSCTYTLRQIEPFLNPENKRKFVDLTILDSVDWLYDIVLPKVNISKAGKSIVLHPVCSLKKMNTENKLVGIAQKCAAEVTVPLEAGCCGMAGDRGFTIPSLTAAATQKESSEVALNKYDGYYSSTTTCEWAMSQATQKNYESILFLVDEALS